MACPAFTATMFGRSKSFASDTISKHTLVTFSAQFSMISEDTLGSFSVPFRGLSGLHCHYMFGRSKSFASDIISKHTLVTFSAQFSKISEDTLGNFSAPFSGLSGLHCHCAWAFQVLCFGHDFKTYVGDIFGLVF